MKKLMGLAMLAGATIAGAGAANAEVSASVSLTTDYVFRGLSQTDNGPAVQGSFDWSNDMVYAGAWASSLDFGFKAPMELDLYAGITPTTGPVSWDLSVVGYFYPNGDDAAAGGELDYWEGIAKGSFSLTEQLSLNGTVAYSPEYFGETGDGLYAGIGAEFALNDQISFSGEYGNQDVDTLGDYDTFNVGASYAVHGFTLDLRYHDTDIDGVDDIVNFSISREL